MGKTSKGKNYNWKKWLRLGSKHTLVKGKDFHCSIHSLRSYIYNKAVMLNVKVSVLQPTEGVLKVTVHNGELDGRSSKRA